MNDTDLDALLTQARSTPPQPSEALLARAVADSLAMQPAPLEQAPKSVQLGKSGHFWDWLASAALPTGLAAATLVGIWIGMSSADSVSLQAAGFLETNWGMDMLHRFPAISGFVGEI